MSDWRPLTQISNPFWDANLLALQSHHPTWSKVIEQIYDSNELFLQPLIDNTYSCAAHINSSAELLIDGNAFLAHSSQISSRLPSLFQEGKDTLIFLLGWDLGQTFRLLWHEIKKRGLDRTAIVIIEPDFRLLAASMVVWDWNPNLSSNRVFWAVGSEWQAMLKSIIHEQHLFAYGAPQCLFSCTHFIKSHPSFTSTARNIVEQAMQVSRHHFEQAMTEAAVYYRQKPPDKLQKAMAIHYAAGMAVPYIQERFLLECVRQGMEVVHHQPSIVGGIGLLSSIARERPDWLLFMNWHPSEFAPLSILNELRLPRVIWIIDDPHNFLPENSRFGPLDFVLTWDRAYEPLLHSKGAQEIGYFPYVADLDGCTATRRDEFISPVSYIGQVKALDPNSLGLSQPETQLVKEVGVIKARQPHLDYRELVWEHQANYSLNLIRDPQDAMPQRIRRALYIVANARRRIDVLERAIPFGLKIYGNQDWRILLQGHPLLSCYSGPAHPQRDVPDIFVSSQVNLNIHSIQALTSLNQRDFNCPLLGGFLLTDWVEGAEQAFIPDVEMAFYHSLEDVEAKIHHYISHPDKRESIVHRGRERVRKEHTYAARTPLVLDWLRETIRQRSI